MGERSNPSEAKYMTAGFLLPKEDEITRLTTRSREVLRSFSNIGMSISICVTYDYPGEQEQAEELVRGLLRQQDPENRYELIINSGSTNLGVGDTRTDKSV